MKKKTKFRIVFYSLLLAAILFVILGRPVWYPIFQKVRGKKTLNDVYKTYGRKVEKMLIPLFEHKELKYPPEHVILIGLKAERKLEVWVKEDGNLHYLKTYPFTSYCGVLGPKLMEGDRQIPEGIYRVNFLNPNSSYHLSMQINYPNQFDREMAKIDNRTGLGGEIFIHGSNVTIGCIPIGDENIEELFTLVYKTNILNTTVIISPYDMRVAQREVNYKNLEWLTILYEKINHELERFKNKS